jgi:hypothetical protein
MQPIKIYIKLKITKNGAYFAFCKIETFQQEADLIDKAKLIER